MKDKFILDACCGGRMFWFDKNHPNALFIDNRSYKNKVVNANGKKIRKFSVEPEKVMDFRKMELPAESFNLVVFDPPHLRRRNIEAKYSTRYYGALNPDTWEADIRMGFSECFRVLKMNGVLVFKWCETEIPISKILKLADEKPLFGHRSGKAAKTHWITFMKIPYPNLNLT